MLKFDLLENWKLATLTLPHFQNGCDVTVYAMLGRVKMLALISNPSKMHAGVKMMWLNCWRAFRNALWRYIHSPSEIKFTSISEYRNVTFLLILLETNRGHQPFSTSHHLVDPLFLPNMHRALHIWLRTGCNIPHNFVVTHQCGDHSNNKLGHHLVGTLTSHLWPLCTEF